VVEFHPKGGFQNPPVSTLSAEHAIATDAQGFSLVFLLSSNVLHCLSTSGSCFASRINLRPSDYGHDAAHADIRLQIKSSARSR
jgi:hypothetical protein